MNDTLVSVHTYDKQGRVVFERTTQVIDYLTPNAFLITFATARQYRDDKQSFEYYVHSSGHFRVFAFTYGEDGHLSNKYIQFFSCKEDSTFATKVHQIETPEALISFADNTIPDSVLFVTPNRFRTDRKEFFKSYRDSAHVLVNEYWTAENNTTTDTRIEKYDFHGQLVFRYKTINGRQSVNHYKYDAEGHLIEETEIWDIENNQYQKKEYQYHGGQMVKKLVYHESALAFTYNYFYKGNLLVKETMTRITESEHFKKRRKSTTTLYRYEYY